MRLDDSRVLVGIMLAIIISSTTLSVLVENQNDEIFSNPMPDEQNLQLTSQKSNATLSLTDIDSPSVIDIFAGGHNSCLLNSDYQLYCWGSAHLMTLGTAGSDTHIPTFVDFGGDYVVEYSNFNGLVCALTDSQSVYCLSLIHI